MKFLLWSSIIVSIAGMSTNIKTFPSIALLQDNTQIPQVQQLFAALDKGDIEKVLSTLRRHPSFIEARSAYEETPLHLACIKGYDELVDWLLRHGASVNVFSYNKFSPLHLTKKAVIARLLIGAGADLAARDSAGENPLQSAANHKYLEVVNEILKTGHKLDIYSALMIGNTNVVKQWVRNNLTSIDSPKIERDNWPPQEKRTPLMIAVVRGEREIIEILLRSGAKVNETHSPFPGSGPPTCDEISALVYAINKGDLEITKLLLNQGAKLDLKCKMFGSLVKYAQSSNLDPEIIKLLEEKANPK